MAWGDTLDGDAESVMLRYNSLCESEDAMQATIPLDKMSLSEKLHALECLWDDLCRAEDVIPSPDWHGEVLREREQQIQAGETKFVELDEAKRSVLIRIQ